MVYYKNIKKQDYLCVILSLIINYFGFWLNVKTELFTLVAILPRASLNTAGCHIHLAVGREWGGALDKMALYRIIKNNIPGFSMKTW